MHAAQGWSSGNPWWHFDSAVKLLLIAVGSDFASRRVSILGSGMLSCHGQGFLPLVLQFMWQWEEGLILAWDRVLDQRTSWGPIHLCVTWLYDKPSCILCKAFWFLWMRSVVQKPAVVIIYAVYLLVTFVGAGEWEKNQSADSLCLYLISLSVFGECWFVKHYAFP